MHKLQDKVNSGKKLSFIEVILGEARGLNFDSKELSKPPTKRKELLDDLSKKEETLNKLVEFCSKNYSANEFIPNLFKLVRFASDFYSAQDHILYLTGSLLEDSILIKCREKLWEEYRYGVGCQYPDPYFEEDPNPFIGLYGEPLSFDTSINGGIIVPFKKLVIGVLEKGEFFSKRPWLEIDEDKLIISPEEFSLLDYNMCIVFGKEQIKRHLKDNYPTEIEGW